MTCEQCHEPYTADHPPERVPVDRTGEICGTCHTVTYDEWEGSVHHQVGTDCLSCHDVCALETHEVGEGVVDEQPSTMWFVPIAITWWRMDTSTPPTLKPSWIA